MTHSKHNKKIFLLTSVAAGILEQIILKVHRRSTEITQVLLRGVAPDNFCWGCYAGAWSKIGQIISQCTSEQCYMKGIHNMVRNTQSEKKKEANRSQCIKKRDPFKHILVYRM